MTTSAPKIDFKKELRGLYSAPRTPVIIEVPELDYLMIDGRGDPDKAPAFKNAMNALYGTSFAIKFALKREGFDYSVMPLEGVWWTEAASDFLSVPKDQWSWTLMIMQPAQVTEAIVADSLAKASTKSPAETLDKLRLDALPEGVSAQVLHVGPYDAERPTIEALHTFIREGSRVPRGLHHEIYLGDPNKARPENLRTIIRQPVEEVR